MKMTSLTKCLCRGFSSWVVISSYLLCFCRDCKNKMLKGVSFLITGQSKELRDLLCNPHLRQLLESIDSADSKYDAMKVAMQEPLFTEFSDQCLKIVENRTEWRIKYKKLRNELWSLRECYHLIKNSFEKVTFLLSIFFKLLLCWFLTIKVFSV